MANTDSDDSATGLHDLARVGRPQPAVQAAREASRSSLQVEAEAAPRLSPTTEANSPSRPAPAISSQKPKSSRVWRSGDPYYPTSDRDGNHWKEVYEKVDRFDKDLCSGWNSEIDALLTFAGLFSAVVTAFTVESYKLLQPDPQDMTNRILLNVSAQLAGRNVTELPSGFTPAPSSVRINALWFLSLTFSLTAGLVGILCKQWLRHYQQDIPKPLKEALAFRQFRYDSFLRCRVMDILSALPVLLGLGLILFFVGLIDFLWGLDVRASIPVTILVGIVFAFLVITTSAPAFQYVAVIKRYSRSWFIADVPPLFAFKSPQSLAILHLATWLFPLSANPRVPNWASLEFEFFSNLDTLQTYTERAFIWLDETYSHSQDMVHRICLCLQDVGFIAEDMGKYRQLWGFPQEQLMTAATNSLFQLGDAPWLPGATQEESHTRRDAVALIYLCRFGYASFSFNQAFAFLECLIRALNSSHRQISSLEPFDPLFSHLAWEASGHPTLVEQLQEVIWQWAILFSNLLSEGRWGNSARIPMEVQRVSKNLEVFTDEDLESIFNVICTWIDQHSQDADLPSHCWAVLASRSKLHHEPDGTLQDRPPVRNFMAFLDSRFRLGEGVRYLCDELSYYSDSGELFDSFFKALYAWIERNPQGTQSFIHCKTLLTTLWSLRLNMSRDYQSFRDFEAFLEARIAGNNLNVAEQNPAHDP